MKKKKIILFIIALCFIMTASFSSTYAYLIVRSEKRNTMYVGETTVELEEAFIPPKELSPGIIFTKKPSIKNTGNLRVFVRARIDFSDSIAKEFCEDLLIDSHWERNESDGYYYYKNVLDPGSTTESLFEKVTIKTAKSDGSLYQIGDLIPFQITIYTEARHHVSHYDNENCSNSEYLDVWREE